MSIAIIGGILLNVGAFLTMRGWIYPSVAVYILADICWIFLAFESGDLLGMGFIVLGTLFGVIAFYKMHKGIMHKSL